MNEQENIPESTSQNDNSTSSSKVGETALSKSKKSFKDIKRELTEDESKQPGVLKLILEMLESSESERDELKIYLKEYYEADKKVAVLDEKLKVAKKFDYLVSANIGLGGAIMGLTPFFWALDIPYGIISLVVGIVLFLIAIFSNR